MIYFIIHDFDETAAARKNPNAPFEILPLTFAGGPEKGLLPPLDSVKTSFRKLKYSLEIESISSITVSPGKALTCSIIIPAA